MALKNRPFRTLFAVYAVAILVGICEYFGRPTRPRQEPDIYGDPERNFPKAVSHLYPASAEAEYAMGRYFEAKAVRDFDAKAGRGFTREQIQRDPELIRGTLASLKADLDEAARHYERAISLGLKSEESLYYNYALTLIRTEKPSPQIDRAIADWKKNFPLSSRQDLAERRKSIEQGLRNLPFASPSAVNAGPSAAGVRSNDLAHHAVFDSAKQISSAIDAELGMASAIEWRTNPGYVGSDACRECHPAEFDSYRATSHSRAFLNVHSDDEPADTVFDHIPSGHRFRVERRDGTLYHAESLLLDDGTEFPLTKMPLKYRVGSGHFARTYVAEIREGFFVESPVTWYESAHSWGMTPGFDKAGHKSFTRQILENCLLCHCGQVQTSQTNQLQLRIIENSIGCERCHGPGESHISARRAKPISVDDPIVNPRRLSRHLSEAICQQCHLQGDIQIGGPNRRAGEFRPGKNLEDYSTVYRLDNVKTEMTVVGHAEQLGSSACYQQSTSLTCVTCHNPHKPVRPEARVEYYRDVCLNCHQVQDCRAEQSARAAKANDDCVHCHMPKSNTEVPHVTFTHHRIGVDLPDSRRPPPNRPTRDPDDPLIALSDLSILGGSDRERSLMLAKVQSLFIRGSEFAKSRLGLQWKAEISQWLARLQDPDAETQFAHIQFLIACGEMREAGAMAENVLGDPRLRTEEIAAIHQQLAELGQTHGDHAIARDHNRKLTQIRVNGKDWLELGRIASAEGNLLFAMRAFEISRDLLPADPQVYESMLKLSRRENDRVNEEEIRRDILRLKQRKSGRGAFGSK